MNVRWCIVAFRDAVFLFHTDECTIYKYISCTPHLIFIVMVIFKVAIRRASWDVSNDRRQRSTISFFTPEEDVELPRFPSFPIGDTVYFERSRLTDPRQFPRYFFRSSRNLAYWRAKSSTHAIRFPVYITPFPPFVPFSTRSPFEPTFILLL